MQRIPGNKKSNSSHSFPFYAQLSIIVYVPSRNIFSYTNQGKLQYEFGNHFKSIRSENRKRPELLVRMYKVLKLSSVTAGEKALLRTVSCSSFSSTVFLLSIFTYIKYVNLFSRAPFKSSSLMTKFKKGY